MKTKEEIEQLAKEFYPPTTNDFICSPKLVRDAYIEGYAHRNEDNNTMIEKTALKLADAENAIRLIIKHFPKDVLADQMGEDYDYFQSLRKNL